MLKKRLFFLSQLLWQVLFFLTNTIWKDISKIPIWASRNDILDETRWLWLMDAPKSAIGNSYLVANVVYSLAIVEFIACLINIAIHLKKNWPQMTNIWKVIQFAMILCGILFSMIFELVQYCRFINMTAYYLLRYSIVTPEIFSVVVIILSISYKMSKGFGHKCQL